MMKIKFLVTIFLSLVILTGTLTAQSDFNTFWTKFKTAVKKADKATVVSLTKFPVSMPFGMRAVKSKADFLARYNKIFSGEANAARCFENTKPEKREAFYEVACTFKSEPESSDNRPIVYTFELTKQGWRFVSLDNINE
jgi:hypothetical protein